MLNRVSEYLFNLLEKRSLYKASEYLALQMLTQEACLLEDRLLNRFEMYRAMKEGNIAPDINFAGYWLSDGDRVADPMKLTDLNYNNVLLIFGASWCSKCTEDIPGVMQYYDTWKAKGLDVIFISLDTDPEQFRQFTKDFPWPSYCDTMEWENQIVMDYHVFATPTMFILDNKREIILRPVSIKQVDAWVKKMM